MYSKKVIYVFLYFICPDSMSCLKFDISGRYLVCSGGKHVHALHNVTGYRATVAELEEKLRTASGPGMKERLKQQVSEARYKLAQQIFYKNLKILVFLHPK